jgi:hypothetical protein
MTTSLNTPREIRVFASGKGRPAAIMLKGRQKKVSRIINAWRLDDEWWREEIARRYFQLELADGSVATVFQDLISGRWYQQRY